MTCKDLEKAGYKKYTGGAAKFKYADCYYAKMFTDKLGKKYQIVIYVYDYSNKPEFDHLPVKISFMPEVQIRNRDDDFCVDIIYHVNAKTTLKDIEDYYDQMWRAHGFIYYEMYEGDNHG